MKNNEDIINCLKKNINREDIILLGLLPARLFTYISAADSLVSTLEAKEFSVFLIKFFNYYYGSY
ncbi:hypothetical protein KA977_13360, partial [Candidatus Dependentiae bacterium]|nr:hypothetical protein [Candidatus Dependentiae bacterium]